MFRFVRRHKQDICEEKVETSSRSEEQEREHGKKKHKKIMKGKFINLPTKILLKFLKAWLLVRLSHKLHYGNAERWTFPRHVSPRKRDLNLRKLSPYAYSLLRVIVITQSCYVVRRMLRNNSSDAKLEPSTRKFYGFRFSVIQGGRRSTSWACGSGNYSSLII